MSRTRFHLALFGLAALSVALLAPSALVACAAASPPHVMVVVFENASYEGVVGNGQMPYVNGLVATNGSVSTTDLCHPSLGNYLGVSSGQTYSCPPDTVPADATYAGPQLTDELAAAGIGWKAYMEDMPVACDLSDTFGPGHYDVNHNPFMYFNSVRNNPSQCNRDVPYPQLTADLNAGTAPPFLWVSPNLIHDMHDGTPPRLTHSSGASSPRSKLRAGGRQAAESSSRGTKASSRNRCSLSWSVQRMALQPAAGTSTGRSVGWSARMA